MPLPSPIRYLIITCSQESARQCAREHGLRPHEWLAATSFEKVRGLDTSHYEILKAHDYSETMDYYLIAGKIERDRARKNVAAKRTARRETRAAKYSAFVDADTW